MSNYTRKPGKKGTKRKNPDTTPSSTYCQYDADFKNAVEMVTGEPQPQLLPTDKYHIIVQQLGAGLDPNLMPLIGHSGSASVVQTSESVGQPPLEQDLASSLIGSAAGAGHHASALPREQGSAINNQTNEDKQLIDFFGLKDSDSATFEQGSAAAAAAGHDASALPRDQGPAAIGDQDMAINNQTNEDDLYDKPQLIDFLGLKDSKS